MARKRRTPTVPAVAATAIPAAPSRWIMSSAQDLLLFVATPLLIIPLVLWLQSGAIGMSVEMISILVAGLGAMGHHLPGMIRAYSDQDLFARFRARFIIAPLFLLAVCVPLAQQNLNAMLVVLLFWGCWHGLMQVYGFVRIYDAKVGSTAAVTAYCDWLVCLFGFVAGFVFSDGRMANLLDTWYTAGGPLIPPSSVHALRLIWGTLSVVVLVAFLANFIYQWQWGQRPNAVKLLMLASGIGFWWFAMVSIGNIVLGIAMFEIFHDVQYLAIVWIYNRRRIDRRPDLGLFMRFLFRPRHAMLFLYVGLVFVYGMISVVATATQQDGLKKSLTAIVWASTILHFYFDGFIWKVRERSTREGLGVSGGKTEAVVEQPWRGELIHGLKWSPFIVLVSWLAFNELGHSQPAPRGMTHRLWPDELAIRRTENIAAAIPDDVTTQARLAAMLDNVGRTVEAKQKLSQMLEHHPTFAAGHMLLANIHFRLGEWESATKSFQRVLEQRSSPSQQFEAHLRLAEAYERQGQWSLAAREYEAVVALEPSFTPAVLALENVKQRLNQPPGANPSSNQSTLNRG